MSGATPPAPSCTSAPRWEPKKWNSKWQWHNNCYAYAVDDDRKHPDFPQPGGKSGLARETMLRFRSPEGDVGFHYNIQQLLHCVEKDGLKRARGMEQLSGHYLVALAVTPAGFFSDDQEFGPEFWDYHWWRQDSNGRWSHKLASGDAKRVDADGKPISDPRTCNRGAYKIFVGFFHVPEGGISVETVVRNPAYPLHLPQPKFR